MITKINTNEFNTVKHRPLARAGHRAPEDHDWIMSLEMASEGLLFLGVNRRGFPIGDHYSL